MHFFNCNWKQGLAGFHVSFINTYHGFIINFVDSLLFKSIDPKVSVEILDMSDFDVSDVSSIKEKRFYVSDRPIIKSENSNEPTQSRKRNLEEFFSDELSKVFPKRTFPKMFKIVRCLLAKNVISDDELILKTTNVFDFLSFTQRLNMTSSHSQSPDRRLSSDEYEFENRLSTEPTSLGYLYVKKSDGSKKGKRDKRVKKRSDKKMLKLCKKLKKIGVLIPVSLIKNVKVREIFSN